MTKEIEKVPGKIADWKRFDNWHDLLNAICINRGYQGNTELAYLFCRAQGKTYQKNIEAAARNLSNWRSGSNLPNRTNLRTLTAVLDLSANSELQNRWFELYKLAGQQHVSRKFEVTNVNVNNRSVVVFLTEQGWKPTALLMAVFAAVIIGAFWLIVPQSLNAADIERLKQNNIPWLREVSLRVGEEAVVHGKRGKCGELPKSEEKIQAALPTHLKTGVLKTGKLGVRNSRRCDGPTPAREIVFKALYPGKETFHLYDDGITVIVTE